MFTDPNEEAAFYAALNEDAGYLGQCGSETRPCEHERVKWEPTRGQFRCLNPACDAPLDIPELTQALGRELRKPYDVIVEQKP